MIICGSLVDLADIFGAGGTKRINGEIWKKGDELYDGKTLRISVDDTMDAGDGFSGNVSVFFLFVSRKERSFLF